MKRIQIGFLAIVAIMAMSFTIASHEGAFKSTVVSVAPQDCYTPNITLPSCEPIALLTASTPCATAKALENIGTAVNSVNVPAAIEDCEDIDGVFCCATLVQINQKSCLTTPHVSFSPGTGKPVAFYAIDRVFCREN
jgi:hypothetical protein